MQPLSYLTKVKYHLLLDKRILCYQEFGDRHGVPVFYSHTTSGSKLEGEFYHQTALEFGFRLICVDRPGIGDSTYLPKRTLLDYPQDIIELANELNITKFGLIGWSGGAAYSLAVSYAHPEKVLFCILVAGYPNFKNPSEASSHLRSTMDKILATNHKKYPRMLRMYLDLLSLKSKAISKLSRQQLISSQNLTDRKIVTNKLIGSILFRSQQEAYKEGSRGPYRDLSIQYSDWGFSRKEIKTSINIFHGDTDDIVPISFSHLNQESLPSCQLNILANEGHFFPCVSSHKIFSLAAEKTKHITNLN